MNLILVPINADSHSFFDVRRRHLITQVDDEFGELLHVDDVLWIVGISVDDFRASRHLKRLLGERG